MEEAKSPEIMRAYQRDQEIKLIFKFVFVESAESIFDYRKLNQDKLGLISDMFYLWATTLRGK